MCMSFLLQVLRNYNGSSDFLKEAILVPTGIPLIRQKPDKNRLLNNIWEYFTEEHCGPLHFVNVV